MSRYHLKLLIFLSVATFFEGYDFLALSQILPTLRADFGLESRAWAGIIFGCVNAGTIAAYFLIREADRIGRKRTLTITIAGYTILTFFSALSTNIWFFIICQFFARVFLLGEWAVSMIIAAEEFPPEKRGLSVGLIQAFSALGGIVCAGVVPFLLQTQLSWRAVYLVGVAPLIMLAFLRRTMKETDAFKSADTHLKQSLFSIWQSPYRNRMLLIAAIWFLAYIPANNAVSFWKEYAMDELGYGKHEVAKTLVKAAVVAMPLVFLAAKLIDLIGRRKSAVLIFMAGGLGVFGAYTSNSSLILTISLCAGIFSASAFLSVLNALSTELFPTALRANAFAWSNNLIGRLGYVLSPFVIGGIAESAGFGLPMRFSASLYFVALALLLWKIPETKGKPLEETSAI